MKRIIMAICLLSALALAVPAFSEDIPDLTGIWRAQEVHRHQEEDGFLHLGEPAGEYEIIEQQGRVFHGVKRWKARGIDHSEEFSGIIAADGEIYMAEDEDGMDFGDLTGENTMSIYYMADNPARTMILYLERD